jgi:hypothetical protein
MPEQIQRSRIYRKAFDMLRYDTVHCDELAFSLAF